MSEYMGNWNHRVGKVVIAWDLLGGHDLLLVEAGVGQTGVCVMVNISFWLTGGSWQPKILVAFY